MAADPPSSDLHALAQRLPLAKRDVVFHARPWALRAQIASAGREHRVGGDGYDWHGLRRGAGPFSVLQYTLAGGGNLVWRGTAQRLVAGSLMLVQVPHDHRYWLPDGGTWQFCWICLLGSEVEAACQAVHVRLGPVLMLDRQHPLLAAVVPAISEVLGVRPISPYRASAHAYAIAMALVELADAADPAMVDAGLAKAERLCRERLDQDLQVSELAEVAGLSRNHFTKRFHEVFGKSPKEYHTNLRIQHAADLLRAGQTVRAVSAACGFAEATYFCKVFRKLTGMTPGSFRDGGMFVRG